MCDCYRIDPNKKILKKRWTPSKIPCSNRWKLYP